MQKIVFTAHQKAELVEADDDLTPLNPGEIRGHTLVSLTSPGTELNWGFLGKTFPCHPGYACVFEVDELGAEVTDLKKGDRVLASAGHQGKQRATRESVIPLPAGLAPESAVFARLMGVSMSTLNTTTAHPPARVLVTGLGPVGNLAAQIFSACGYFVAGVDPVKARREWAVQAGLKNIFAAVEESPDLDGGVALHLECSGHEAAVLAGCKCVRKRGEVVLIGVPWQRRTDLPAFEILHAVFHRYVVLRSGWEWEVPLQPADFHGNSIVENHAAAVQWLADGKIKVDHLAGCHPPGAAQAVYEGLLNQSLPAAAALFDWRL